MSGEFYIRVPGRVIAVRREMRDGKEYTVTVLADDTHRVGSKEEWKRWHKNLMSSAITAEQRHKKAVKKRQQASYEEPPTI